jgi:hypothetical protein
MPSSLRISVTFSPSVAPAGKCGQYRLPDHDACQPAGRTLRAVTRHECEQCRAVTADARPDQPGPLRQAVADGKTAVAAMYQNHAASALLGWGRLTSPAGFSCGQAGLILN